MDPTGWHIEGNLTNQVAVSTGSTVQINRLDCVYPQGLPLGSRLGPAAA